MPSNHPPTARPNPINVSADETSPVQRNSAITPPTAGFSVSDPYRDPDAAIFGQADPAIAVGIDRGLDASDDLRPGARPRTRKRISMKRHIVGHRPVFR